MRTPMQDSPSSARPQPWTCTAATLLRTPRLPHRARSFAATWTSLRPSSPECHQAAASLPRPRRLVPELRVCLPCLLPLHSLFFLPPLTCPFPSFSNRSPDADAMSAPLLSRSLILDLSIFVRALARPSAASPEVLVGSPCCSCKACNRFWPTLPWPRPRTSIAAACSIRTHARLPR